jgi:cell division protein ZapE
MTVMRLDARTDFRMEKLAGAPIWYVPADAAADAAMDQAWRRLAGGLHGAAHEVISKGRVIHVPRAAKARRVFHSPICANARSAALDYLKLGA